MPVQAGGLVLRGPQMRNPRNALSRDGALGTIRPLLRGLEDILASRGLDRTGLVGFGGVAMTPPACQPLNHGA